MRRKMLPQVIVAIVIISQLQVSFANGEAVIVDEDTVEVGEFREIKRQKKESYTNINGQKIAIGCKTARNMDGECMSFGECYPLFRLRDTSVNAGKGSTTENKAWDVLKGLYRGVSGQCTDAMLATISKALGTSIPKQNYVCCPITSNYSDASKPTRMARPPGPVEPTTYQASQCGRYVVGKSMENETASHSSSENETDSQTLEDNGVPNGRIVNGDVAKRGQFPYAVALMMNGRQFCGGSLIDSQHVLCAAHCVYFMNRRDVNRLRVQLGDHNIYSTNDGRHEVRGVSNVYYHRSFSMKTIYDDVSVLRLSSPISYTNFIRPVCLSTNTWNYVNQHATVAGWGQLSDRGQQSSVLRWVNVKVWNQQDCSRRYQGKAPAGISRGMVCAGGSGYDSCKGDSGGPLTIRKGSQIEQIGIVSWGIGCGSFPGVYTRVDQYLQWINKNRR